jgi:hypothetical protein
MIIAAERLAVIGNHSTDYRALLDIRHKRDRARSDRCRTACRHFGRHADHASDVVGLDQAKGLVVSEIPGAS